MNATALPRLLLGDDRPGAMDLAAHRAAHGPAPEAADLVERCEQAGLRGRGGAHFPTAAKLRAVASGRRGARSVVVNGVEGEPMSHKDRVLLERAPHLVLDGAEAAARAVGAGAVVVALPASAIHAHAVVTRAVAERRDGKRTRVAVVPDGFVTGEETALIQALEGRPAKPTVSPPRPSERGLGRRPTLVQNAETMAHLALVARHGAAWFRALGPADHPGTTLVSLGGCVRDPGVHEVALGTPVAEILDAAGGVLEPVRAVLVGGYHGAWMGPGQLSVRLDHPSLATAGLRLGAGVVVALPRSACPVAEVARVLDWLAGETAGQCGPCVHGLAAIAAQVAALRDGRGDERSRRRLRRWGEEIAGRGACHHPDGSARFLASALRVFEPEFELHRRFGACEDCDRAPLLDIPPSIALAA